MKLLYVASGENDNIKKAYITKENYRKVKNFISHPDFVPKTYFKDYVKFAPYANKALILDLKCHLKDCIDEMIAEKLIEKNSAGQLFNDIEKDPMEFGNNIHKKANISKDKIEKLRPFYEKIFFKLLEIKMDFFSRPNLTMDNDIALVELEKHFEFCKGVLPPCLLENDEKQFDNSFIRKSI